jgi:hypothetical protein
MHGKVQSWTKCWRGCPSWRSSRVEVSPGPSFPALPTRERVRAPTHRYTRYGAPDGEAFAPSVRKYYTS